LNIALSNPESYEFMLLHTGAAFSLQANAGIDPSNNTSLSSNFNFCSSLSTSNLRDVLQWYCIAWLKFVLARRHRRQAAAQLSCMKILFVSHSPTEVQNAQRSWLLLLQTKQYAVKDVERGKERSSR